jgi:hypothetical protein
VINILCLLFNFGPQRPLCFISFTVRINCWTSPPPHTHTHVYFVLHYTWVHYIEASHRSTAWASANASHIRHLGFRNCRHDLSSLHMGALKMSTCNSCIEVNSVTSMAVKTFRWMRRRDRRLLNYTVSTTAVIQRHVIWQDEAVAYFKICWQSATSNALYEIQAQHLPVRSQKWYRLADLLCGPIEKYTASDERNILVIYTSLNIIRMIKLSRMRWVGYAARMRSIRKAYNISAWRPEWKRSLRGHRRRWEDIIKMNLKEIWYEGALDSTSSG